MIIEGHAQESLSTHSYTDLISFCVDKKNKGFFIHKAKCKIMWPFFWIKKYKVVVRRNFICDSDTKEVEFVPKKINIHEFYKKK